MLQHNLILNTDSYKASHYLQYPPGSTHVSCYIESRGGSFSHSLFFGLQMFLKAYLSKPIAMQHIDEAEALFTVHGLPFNRAGWEHILHAYGGYLPLRIEAVPEGAIIPVKNVLVQVVNTDPSCYWLSTYIETALLRAVWYPTSVATISWECKQVIHKYLQETADTLDGLPFKLHDFGARGASSCETSALGGAAHLVNFMGSDTVMGVIAARDYYHEPMAGISIPAAEHSTITAWGEEGEVDAYSNMLEKFDTKDKLVAVVSDSYDIWHAIESIWGKQLKAQIMSTGGTLVIRPDSGDPLKVVPEVVEKLMAIFGTTINSKGYRVLPSYLRVIQGDEVSRETIEAVLATMKQRKQSADNVAFGMGGALLQRVNRDTMMFAMKASAIQVNGQWRDIYKHPVTGSHKQSKKGRLALIKDENGVYHTIQQQDLGSHKNLLIPVFENGKILKDWHFSEIREQAGAYWPA